MRATVVTVLLAVTLAGCSDTGTTADPAPGASTAPASTSPTGTTADEATLLPSLWEVPLVIPPTRDDSYPNLAVSEGYLLATGTIDTSPGTTNPMPNVQLDYGIADVETGEVVVAEPLDQFPNTVRAVPGTDLFLALADDRMGVLDAATASFLWSSRTVGDEVLALTADRIWMGRVTPRGAEICRTIETGAVVHDRACHQAALTDPQVIDGVSWSEDVRSVTLPEGGLLDVPVTYAQDATTFEQLWAYGDTSVSLEGGELRYETSTFAGSGLGLVRVDYSLPAAPDPQNGERTWPDAVLHLVDVRTGQVVSTLGRVEGGDLLGFAGDVAIFEQPTGTGVAAVGYRLGS